ncbi:MAG: Gldg family protein [Candidatus Methylacidiphilales bacterium]|nr:GldG family protein [Candidatus Methylacidiphilales bacterium]
MKRSSLETVLYSGIGIAAVLLILVAVNFLAGFVKQRIDLTQDKAYTLSKGTREILSKLDTPVQVRLYVTQDASMPVILKNYVQSVQDLLSEYSQASRGLIEVQRLNPEPDSDAEDSARMDGITGETLTSGDKVFFGLSITMLDKKQTLPFLSPTRERLLEYDITRAITQVIAPSRPVIGLMTPLPMAGRMDPMMMQMGGRQTPPWAIYNELKADFTITEVPVTAEEIPANVSVLVVVNPVGITESAQYAIDQYLMRGGKMVAFLDPASPFNSANPAMGGGGAGSSTFNKLLPAWGIQFNPAQMVADLINLAELSQGKQPSVLVLNEKSLDSGDVVTADNDNAVLVFSGAFTGKPVAGLKETVLLRSSKESQLIDALSASLSRGGDSIMRNFTPSGQEYSLAIRLTGKFKTAFPNGKPAATPPPANGAQPPPAPAAAAATESLKESKTETSVILFGDSDFIQDPIAVRESTTLFGQRVLTPANGNLAIAQAAIENLAGNSNLVNIRGRANRERPFTVVRELQAKAEASYRAKISQLESSLSETEQRLAQLQQGKEGNQKFILSPEQQKELANFRKKEAEVRKELKVVRRDLRTEIDALETRLKWINIAAVPAIVALVGIGFALWRQKHAAAR